MKKQSIIISSYDDLQNPYYAGGGAIAIHETAKRLAKNHNVTVITGKYPGSKNCIVDGVSYIRVGISTGGPKIGQLAYQACLPLLVMRESYSVWFESFTPPFSTGLLPLFTKKRVVGLVHMLSGADMRRKYYLPFDVIEAMGLKVYPELIAPSEQIASELRKLVPNAIIHIIPNGVNPVADALQTKKKQILFLGRIEVNQKGLDLLIDACSGLKALKEYPLVIAGGGEERQVTELKNLIAASEAHAAIKYVGKVAGKTRDTLMREAIAIIVPSRFETFSLTALEALASGIPLVTFGISGLSWIPAKVRVTVEAFDVAKLRNALQKLVTDQALQKKLTTESVIFGKTFTWDKTAERYEELLSK